MSLIKASRRGHELSIKHGHANLVLLKSRLLSFILICEINMHVTPEPNPSFSRLGKGNFGLVKSLSLKCCAATRSSSSDYHGTGATCLPGLEL